MWRKVFSFEQKLIEHYENKRIQENIKVYLFHRIESDEGNTSICKQNFEEFILSHLKQGYSFLPIEKLADQDAYHRKSAIITFDDMFSSAFLYAVPFLQTHEIPYTVFISPSLIEKQGYITSRMLNVLRTDPLCVIGGHCMNHKVLRYLSTEEKKRELSRKDMEAALGQNIKYLAFPYGSVYACDKESLWISEQNGYEMCFSTLNYPASWRAYKKNAMFIPRININDSNYMEFLF